MAIATPSLFLNTKTLQDGDSNPFLKSLANAEPMPPWSRVSGPTVGALRLYLVESEAGAIPTRVDAGNNTLHLVGKVSASDTDFVLSVDFDKTADGDYFYYEADPFSLAIDQDFWGDKPKLEILCDIVERDDGDDVNSWRVTLNLTRGNGDGGANAPEFFLKVSGNQTLTEEQKEFGRVNLGLESGYDASFNSLKISSHTLTLGGNVAFTATGRSLAGAATTTAARNTLELGLNDSPTFSSITTTTATFGGATTVANDGEFDINSGSINLKPSGYASFAGGNAVFDTDGNLICSSLTLISNSLTIDGYSISFSGNFIFSGANDFTGILTGPTTVTFPTTGTLGTVDASISSTNSGRPVVCDSTTGRIAKGFRVYPTVYYIDPSAMFELKNGAASSTSANACGVELNAGTDSSTGYAVRRITPSNSWVASVGKAAGVIAWGSNTVEITGKIVMQTNFSSGSTMRVTYGRTSSYSTGAAAHATMPQTVELRFNSSTGLQLIATTASVTTSATSSFTPTIGEAFEFRIISVGGVVTLYCNGSLTATNNGGPNADSGTSSGCLTFGVENTGTVAVNSSARCSPFQIEIY
jgi:hypothetical protein